MNRQGEKDVLRGPATRSLATSSQREVENMEDEVRMSRMRDVREQFRGGFTDTRCAGATAGAPRGGATRAVSRTELAHSACAGLS